MKLVELSISDFMNELASSAPTPGGGSAAALSGLMGISLLQMVAGLTTGRKKYAEHEELMQNILKEAENQHQALLEAIDRDAWAYSKVSAAYKMPKNNYEEIEARESAIQEALKIATWTPFSILTHCNSCLKLAHSAIKCSNTNAASDLGVAAAALKTGIDGAWMNILINLGSIDDEAFKDDIKDKAKDILDQAKALNLEINDYVMSEIF